MNWNNTRNKILFIYKKNCFKENIKILYLDSYIFSTILWWLTLCICSSVAFEKATTPFLICSRGEKIVTRIPAKFEPLCDESWLSSNFLCVCGRTEGRRKHLKSISYLSLSSTCPWWAAVVNWTEVMTPLAACKSSWSQRRRRGGAHATAALNLQIECERSLCA